MPKEKKVKLSNGMEALVDEEDYDFINQYRWYGLLGYAAHGFYTLGSSSKEKPHGIVRTYYMHQLILKAPKGFQVDHINGNRLDNRKSNLRICTPGQNIINKSKQTNNTSNYKGVTRQKASRKWQAIIGFNRRKLHLGFYQNKIHAAMAYDMAAKDLHGEFVNLNFPDGIHG